MVKMEKGWLRIVESIIGVLIVLMALIYFVSYQAKQIGKEEKAKEVLNFLLDEIERNMSLRDKVIQQNLGELNKTIALMISSYYPIYDYSFCVVDPDAFCSQINLYKPLPNKEIFSDSLVISTLDPNANLISKKIILYLWIK